MNSGTPAPRTLEVAKSTVWLWVRAMRVSTLVGSSDDMVASVSSEATLDASRATPMISLIAAKRSVIGMRPVGTNMRVRVKAFAPELSLRVLMAIEVRSDSTGEPFSWW